GIWRRLAIIPFTVQIPLDKVDKRLTSKLKREMKAILNWMSEGYLLWRSTGLQEPECIKAQRDKYRVEMDSVETFIEECCIRDGQGKVKAKPLFLAYREWANENGHYMMNSTKFGREMNNKFKKLRSNGTYYVGLKMLEENNNSMFRISY
ncbi:MAG: DNA primase, partial [Peptostreptococcaceae bacterium]|nr:DNA primase [Peptostreptococcaceae bacterium]